MPDFNTASLQPETLARLAEAALHARAPGPETWGDRPGQQGEASPWTHRREPPAEPEPETLVQEEPGSVEPDEAEPSPSEAEPEAQSSSEAGAQPDPEPHPEAANARADAPRAKTYRQVKSWADLADHIADIARRILGTEIQAESTRETLRFGHKRGSIAVEIDGPKKGTWYDHTTSEGGGPLQLLMFKGNMTAWAAHDWIRDNLGIEIKQEQRRRRVTEYIYRDENGVPRSRKVRWEPKFFSWERADGEGGFVGGKGCMNGVRRVPYRLPEIASAPRDSVVFVLEGEKDCDNGAVSLGLLTTCNPDGGSKTKSGDPGKWRAEFSESLRGRNVVIIPDNDDVGISHARTVANALAAADCQVRIVALPGAVKDLSDWIDAGGTRAQLEALVAEAPLFEAQPAAQGETDTGAADQRRQRKRERAKSRGPTPLRGLPVIVYEGGKLPEATDKAESLLAQHDSELFQRGEFLVRIGHNEEIETADGERVKGARLVRVEKMHLQDRATRHIDFQVFDERMEDFKSINCPPDVAVALLQRTGLRPNIPYINGVTTTPLFRADGTILAQPGFDKESRILYVPPIGISYPKISESPTKEEALNALNYLLDLLCEFPFILEDGNLAIGKPSPSRSVALCTMITPIVRHAIPTAPINAFDATAAGSGKSKLARLASIIARGHAAPVVPGGSDLNPEEFEKKISASLIAGDAIIVIDNVEGRLSSELLCSAATESMLNIRVLGLSKHAQVPNRATFIVNGNGLTIVGDLVRRTIRCSLDPKVDRPELRVFQNPDPVLRAMQNRAQYVGAILTVLRAFHVAGRPKQTDPLGSFEEWSKLVRDTLVWLGEPDPCDTMDRMRLQDPRRKALADVVYWWNKVIGNAEVTAKRVIEYAEEREWIEREGRNVHELKYPEFRDALMAVAAGKTGGVDPLKFGQWVNRNKLRFVDGLRIEPGLALDHSGSTRWKVVKP